ncbi:MAG: IS4 family transposase [Cytophagales bacterium]
MQSNKEFISGQPIIGQLLSLIPNDIFKEAETATNSDKYYKKLNSKSHFIILFYATLTRNSSLREVCKNITLVFSRLIQFGFKHLPCKSTLSDANNRRSSEYFEKIYYLLYQRYKKFLIAQHFSMMIGGEVDRKDVEIFDSSTITLFKEILKGAGRNTINGRKKGGIKAFSKMNLVEGVPNFVCYGAASKNETSFLNCLKLEKGSIAVFDKGFNKYKFYQLMTDEEQYFVTRKKDNMKYEVLENYEVNEEEKFKGIIKDQRVKVEYKEKKITRTVELRIVEYLDYITGETIEFITNISKYSAFTITQLYKNRWVIEVLFKQLKQNFELKYFLSDSENGIKSQIWMALILNLLFTVIHKMTKEAEDFSTMVMVAAKNLCSNVHFMKFIMDSKSFCRRYFETEIGKIQLSLFNEKYEGIFEKT